MVALEGQVLTQGAEGRARPGPSRYQNPASVCAEAKNKTLKGQDHGVVQAMQGKVEPRTKAANYISNLTGRFPEVFAISSSSWHTKQFLGSPFPSVCSRFFQFGSSDPLSLNLISSMGRKNASRIV